MPPTTSSRKYSRGLTRTSPPWQAGQLTLRVRYGHGPAQLHLERSAPRSGSTPSPPQLKKSGDKWLTVWKPAILVPELADGEIVSSATHTPQRADILGAGGVPLVTYRPVVNVGIDKPALGGADPADSATKLAQLVGVDPAAYAQQVAAAGPEAFVAAITLREDGPDHHRRADRRDSRRPRHPGLPSAGTHPHLRPRPAGHRSRGECGADRKIDGALKAGDTTGTGGLQQQYDAQLRGSDGIQVFGREGRPHRRRNQQALPNAGRRVLFQTEIKAGTPLKTTLDPKLQQLAEDVLGKVGPASAIVALRPSSGAVLAAASGPGSNGYDTAMLGQYAPGSIFKMVDSLAMFRNGMTPDSKVDCPATLTVDGRTFKNAEGYPESSLGSVTLRDAFAHSCNTAFINARDTVSQAQLESAATSLGVAVEAPALGAAAFLGSVPGDAEGTEHAASMIGQGKVLLSPLAAAIMAGSVAKGAPVAAQLVLNPNEGVTSPGAESTATAGTGTGTSPAAPPSGDATTSAAGTGHGRRNAGNGSGSRGAG